MPKADVDCIACGGKAEDETEVSHDAWRGKDCLELTDCGVEVMGNYSKGALVVFYRHPTCALSIIFMR